MFKDDAWRSASVLTPETADAEISDARLLSTRTANGDREWTVEAPITFKYSVRETPDVLDLSNDALVFGHLGDAASLARAKGPNKMSVTKVENTKTELRNSMRDSTRQHAEEIGAAAYAEESISKPKSMPALSEKGESTLSVQMPPPLAPGETLAPPLATSSVSISLDTSGGLGRAEPEADPPLVQAQNTI